MSDKNKFIPVSDAVVDEREPLGKILAAELKKIGETGPCLSEEDIAALAEGTVSGAEKDRMMKHLSACDTCIDVYVLTSGLRMEEEEKKERFKIARFKPLALAASILIVVVSIYVYYRTNEIPKSTKEFLTMEEPAQPTGTAPSLSYAPSEKPVGGNIEKKDRSKRKGAKAAPKDEEQKQTGETRLKDEDESRKAVVVTVPVMVPGTQQPMTQNPEVSRSNVMVEKEKESLQAATVSGMESSQDIIEADASHLSRLKTLCAHSQSKKAYIPTAELDGLFKETYELTNQANNIRVDYQIDGANINEPSKKETPSTGIAPLVTVIGGGKENKMIPNMSYFLSKSVPGTIENRFFKLATIGWSDSQGNYYNTGGANTALGELGKQWETLYPALKGIYKAIAANTIAYLKKNPR